MTRHALLATSPIGKRAAIAAAFLLASLLSVNHAATAQAVTAVPRLNLEGYMGAWYEQARYPNKREKTCVSDNMVLYALGDKPNSFQIVTSCEIKGGNSDAWNGKGKAGSTGDGRLKLSRFLIFSTKYWVLAAGPDNEWALVGNPNRKFLWVLSKTATLKPEVLAEIEAKATAEGFDTAKLLKVAQHN
jgi:apolipoprotein D and lipocalin family protein